MGINDVLELDDIAEIKCFTTLRDKPLRGISYFKKQFNGPLYIFKGLERAA